MPHLFCLLLLTWSIAALSQESSLPVQMWTDSAPRCADPKTGFNFPSKANCEDGDSTLFHGLLCAVGVQEGCESAKRSQDASGRWHRSPRIKSDPSLRTDNSFSPDMAIGVQLYLLTRNDADAARRWVAWMEANTPCMATGSTGCLFRSPVPRFCTDDTEKGCTIRPGDAALLARTLEALGVMPATDTTMGAYLRAFRDTMPSLLPVDALVNKPGYSRHLVAAGILLMSRVTTTEEENARLLLAANILASRESWNPFFLWLASRPKDAVNDAITKVCPKTKDDLPKTMSEWTWEREEADEAWKQSMLWDCVFAASLK